MPQANSEFRDGGLQRQLAAPYDKTWGRSCMHSANIAPNLLKAVTIVLSRHLAPLVSQTCYHVAGGGGIDKTAAICPVRDSRSLPKQAASFDLPITLGILAGSGQNKSGSDRQR